MKSSDTLSGGEAKIVGGKVFLRFEGTSPEQRTNVLQALEKMGLEVLPDEGPGKRGESEPHLLAPLVEGFSRLLLETAPSVTDFCSFLDAASRLAGFPMAVFGPPPGEAKLSCKAASRGFPDSWTSERFFSILEEGGIEASKEPLPLLFPLDGNDLSKGFLAVAVPGGIDAKQASPFMEALATALGQAQARGERFRALDRTVGILESSFDRLVESCVRLLELRGNETEGHGSRVTALAVKLGERMGLSGRELVDLRRGALLHDIGKLTLPDGILQKEGPLSESEWKIMRQHTTRAYEALKPVRELRGALEIPLSHHERFDGSGYPRGLKGEDIPLAGRIFAVVDVWDSILSDRTYRRGCTREKALDHLRKEAGAKFDPEAVIALSSILEEEPSLFERPD